jgi:DNA-binding transcriptional LysR family regulator
MRALAGVTQLDDAAAAIGAAARGSLTIATNPSPGIAWLPRIVAGFRRARPDVTFTLLNRSSREVRDLLAARAFDLGIAEPPFHADDNVLRRYRFASVMVLRRDHPLARDPVLTPQLLDGTPLIGMLPGHATTPRLADAFQTAGARLNLAAQCEFFVISINLAADGVGIALSDPISAVTVAPSCVCARPFAPVLPYEVAMLKPARGGLARLAAAFADEVDSCLKPFVMENGP